MYELRIVEEPDDGGGFSRVQFQYRTRQFSLEISEFGVCVCELNEGWSEWKPIPTVKGQFLPED